MLEGSDFIPPAGRITKDDLRKPGRHVTGVLTFVLADMIVFAMIFMGFMVDRAANTELFQKSAATLSVKLGLFNTLILITSGLFMVLTVIACHKKDIRAVRKWLLVTLLVGLPFAATKIIEYSDKLSHGIDITTNTFYMFYFALTGAHFLHFLGGVATLLFFLLRSWQADPDETFYNYVEAGGIYWHMVDLLWLFIFPLLYLLDNVA